MAGASGAGKSVTANYLLMHLLASGTKALIIDVGGSYIKLIELFGGDYISFEPEADPALNLFYDPADVRRPDSSLDPLRLQFMLTAIETLLVDRDRDSLSNAERAVLTGAVMQLYKDGYIEDGGAPTLRDLAGALTALHTSDDDDLATGRALARGLRHWLTGPHARLLDRRSNIKLTTDIAAFDLKGLPDEVRTPVVLILSAMIWNLVTRDTSERKVVVFDEVWTLLSSPASSRLIAELYRTSRKYGCSILSISQSVEDFTTSDIAGALVNNSATAYLLRHRVGHEIVADTFRLNERQQHVFRALEMRRGQYSELLVLSGDRSFVGRVVLTPLEYWIATTHPDDHAALDTMAVRHPDMALLDLLHACADRWPRGVATLDPDAARESLESLTAPRSTDGPQTAVHTHGAHAA
jgi:conjugal transfer ATP-binding protein TraC